MVQIAANFRSPPPLTQKLHTRRRAWRTEVELWTPARSTNPNSCSTGPALWEIYRKSAVLQGKRHWRTGEKVAKALRLGFSKFWGDGVGLRIWGLLKRPNHCAAKWGRQKGIGKKVTTNERKKWLPKSD